MGVPKPSIPLLDLSVLAQSPGDLSTARDLVSACHESGFCYLRGHGIDSSLETAALDVARAFFALGLESKRALSIGNSAHFRGYTALGHEITRGAPDWREQLDLGLDEPCESSAPGDPAWRRLRGPNQWPHQLPEMQTVIGSWMDAMARLARDCLSLLAVGLDQPADYFDVYMLPRGDPHLKVIRYEGQQPGTAKLSRSSASDGFGQGVGWHRDSGLLTFILQDASAGLEVRTARGEIPAEPLAGTYLMNLGEMLQRATSGYLLATEHRVVSPPPAGERISLAYFAHPKFESRFEPIDLPSRLQDQAPGGDNADPANPVYQCFGDNYLKIRLRSHPDVAARYYADVSSFA